MHAISRRAWLPQKTIAVAFDAVLVLVTLTNFVPFAVVDRGATRLLFGLFLVGRALIALHLAMGLAGLLTALATSHARWLMRGYGVVFALLSVAGFVGGHTALGLFEVNLADNLLHAFFATSLIASSLLRE